jgi:hypothetical protein
MCGFVCGIKRERVSMVCVIACVCVRRCVYVCDSVCDRVYVSVCV